MKKKKIVIMIVMFMLITGYAFINTKQVAVAAKKSNSKEWATAYMKIIKKMNKEDKANKEDSFFYKPYKYDLIYFDKDSIPELVVGNNGYWVSMYTYDKKKHKVYTVMKRWPYGAYGNAGYSYLPKKNCLSNTDSDYGETYYFYGKMKKHKIVNRYSKSLVERHYIDKNKNGYPDSGEFTEKPYYYYGKKQISKKKFDSYLIPGKYKMMVGKMSYGKMKKKLIAKGAE